MPAEEIPRAQLSQHLQDLLDNWMENYQQQTSEQLNAQLQRVNTSADQIQHQQPINAGPFVITQDRLNEQFTVPRIQARAIDAELANRIEAQQRQLESKNAGACHRQQRSERRKTYRGGIRKS